MKNVAIAILAAGRGTRLESIAPKPLVSFRKKPLISYALKAAQESKIGPVFCVVGYQAQFVEMALPVGVQTVLNPDWQEGMSSSVRVALQTAENYVQVSAVCIGLADQPFVSSLVYQRLVEAHSRGAAITVATYHGKRQNPVLIARSLWSESAKLTGDTGLKQILQQHSVVEVPCEDISSAQDIDTMTDLASLERLVSSVQAISA